MYLLINILFIFVEDLFCPQLAGVQVYSWSSPGCRFYKHGWKWVPAVGMKGPGHCWQYWGVTWYREGPAGTGPSAGVCWSWLRDKTRAVSHLISYVKQVRHPVHRTHIADWWCYRKKSPRNESCVLCRMMFLYHNMFLMLPEADDYSILLNNWETHANFPSVEICLKFRF